MRIDWPRGQPDPSLVKSLCLGRVGQSPHTTVIIQLAWSRIRPSHSNFSPLKHLQANQVWPNQQHQWKLITFHSRKLWSILSLTCHWQMYHVPSNGHLVCISTLTKIRQFPGRTKDNNDTNLPDLAGSSETARTIIAYEHSTIHVVIWTAIPTLWCAVFWIHLRSGARDSHKQLPNVMTTTETTASTQGDMLVDCARYFTPLLAFPVHSIVI